MSHHYALTYSLTHLFCCVSSVTIEVGGEEFSIRIGTYIRRRNGKIGRVGHIAQKLNYMFRVQELVGVDDLPEYGITGVPAAAAYNGRQVGTWTV